MTPHRDISADAAARTLDAIYDAPVSAAGWRPALERLSQVFNSHFIDIFARSQDWRQYRGVALGLDRADYEDEFLGTWCSRNVWSKAKPVRAAGEVIATWQMVDRATLVRSDMYSEYLEPRALNEGLRLSLWANEDWIQDISLLRPWEAGPFSRSEIKLGRYFLPHLQRAASLSRRVGQMQGAATVDALDRPAMLLDGTRRVLHLNADAEEMLSSGQSLALREGQVAAVAAASRAPFETAVATAASLAAELRRATSLMLETGTRLDVTPLRAEAGWALPVPHAVLVVASKPAAIRRMPGTGELIERFGLTTAEAELSLALLGGSTLAQIAALRGRSIHTLRSHMARVLAKTHTQRQSDLMRLLGGLEATQDEPAVLRMLRQAPEGGIKPG